MSSSEKSGGPRRRPAGKGVGAKRTATGGAGRKPGTSRPSAKKGSAEEARRPGAAAGGARRARPGGSARARTAGNGSRAPSAGRAQQRGLLAKPPAMPQWMYVTLIAGPVVGILVLIGLNFVGGDNEPVEQPKDSNTVVEDLQKEVPALKKELHQVRALLQSEDPSAKSRVEGLMNRYNNWMDRWDAIFEPKRNQETGQFPPELQGYMPTRRTVNQDRNDLLKIAPF